MRRLITFFLALLISVSGYCKVVEPEVAREYALRYLQHTSTKAVESSTVFVFQKGDVAYTYLVNLKPQGWAIVAADDRVQPILAYSNEGVFDTVGIKKLPFYFWFENYENQIKSIIKSKTLKQHPAWSESYTPSKSVKAVDPLINVTWDQNAGYNEYCPADSRGPGGHVYAGCVAVAMAQCMSVYKHPTVGYGEKQYNHSVYGNQYVNFGAATYSWDLMSSTGANSYVAYLLYHLGVSVSMNYGYDGSGAYSSNVPGAISAYFDYSNKAKYIKRSSYSDEEWRSIMAEEIQNRRPVYYSGDDGSSGHAFNLDGMNEQGAFHFNWGWSGNYNGYYSLASLTPGSHSFTLNQGAVIGFMPRDHKPYDITLSNASVKEKLPVGTVVGTFSVSDETLDDTHTFDVAGTLNIYGNPRTVPFKVESSNLVTTAELSYAKARSYEIVVKVTDKTMNTYEKTFLINVIKETPSGIESDDLVNFKLSHDNGIINFRFNNSFDGRFAVKVYDILGKHILTQHYTKNSGEFSDAVTLNSNLKGMYMVVFDFNNKRVTRKMILN